MQTILIPASYDVWLTALKDHLNRHPGSKADLARYLEKVLEIKFSSAQVKVSQLLAEKFVPSAHTFMDIASWLQRQADALADPPHFTPLARLPWIKLPRPKTGATAARPTPTSRVAEEPPPGFSQAG